MTVTVRTATSADIEAIAGIHVQSWQSAYRGVVPDDILGSMNAQRSMPGWQNTLDSFPGNLTVAQDEAGILGFCCAGAVVDSGKNHPYAFQIYGLHVRPDRHRQGAGSLLLGRAFERMHTLGLAGAVVWTLAPLVQSRRFYEKHGGVVVKTGVWTAGGRPIEEVAYGWPGAGLHSPSVPPI
jgi:GNAT superfamily N-acetyltransferase